MAIPSFRQRDEGVPRGPGVRPTNLAGRRIGKIALASATHRLYPQAINSKKSWLSLVAAIITLLSGVVGTASATAADHWNTEACTALADLAAHFDEGQIQSATVPAVDRRSGSIDVIAVGFNGGS